MPARRACVTDERQHGRLKFVLQCLDFSVPDKIGRIDHEMKSYGAVRHRAGRGESGCRRVLVTRARSAFVMIYDRLKFVEQSVDFWRPYKTNDHEMKSYGAVRRRAGRGERGCIRVLVTRA